MDNTKKKSSKIMYNRSRSEMPLPQENSDEKPIARANSLRELNPTNNNSDLTNPLEKILECNLCYSRLLDPRMLPCQHTFCLSCLQGHVKLLTKRMMKKNQNPPSADEIKAIMDTVPIPLPCPTCKKMINIKCSYNTLTDLPRNIYIDNLLNLMENNCTSPTSPSSPTLRCIKCQTIVQLPGKSCGHCMQVFCSVCWTEHLSTLKSSLGTLLEHLLESEVKLNNRIADFKVQCENISLGINKATKSYIEKLEKQKENSLQQLDDINKLEQRYVEELKNRIKKISGEIKSINFDDIGNEDHKVNTFMKYHTETSKALDDVSQWGDIQLFFDENTFKVTHSNQIYSDDTNQTLNTDNDNPFESIESMSVYYREKEFKTKLVWNKCPRPAGLGIPPWAPNHLYIATTNRKIVLIMDRSISKVIGKLTCPQMQCPQNIAFCEKRLEVYVTDKWKHCIYVFNHEGDYMRTLSNLGSRNGELRSPEGIAVTHDDNIVVCDTGNDRVLILNPENGEQVSLLAGTLHKTPFQVPTGVAVFGDKIIVSDTGNHNVKVYLTTGKLLFEFGTFGTDKSQFRTAEVVTCDPMGFIFVGDSGNGRIQIFTPDGRFVRKISHPENTAEKFSWISGLAVSSQLEIITTDYKQKCLRIFNNYNNM
ncbi:hypothetical protein RN001_000068 [Aquatica leii]|uniref:RING-type domain-containing protein n=1 Tax=Aquatica leii TaxID=1421715 RepID=A0AAN7PED5_9COLE|nr:hypothetical protein RN001_000068 [Aquatica leii]